MAACSATYGSTPFSQRFEPSVRSASRSELRMIPTGSKFAASSRMSVVSSDELGLLAAHDPGERDRALRVGDHEIGRLELAQLAVERAQLLARPRAPDDDPPLRELAAVERVQRAAEREHHVVRDVDGVRDRPLARGATAAPSATRGEGPIRASRKSRPM